MHFQSCHLSCLANDKVYESLVKYIEVIRFSFVTWFSVYFLFLHSIVSEKTTDSDNDDDGFFFFFSSSKLDSKFCRGGVGTQNMQHNIEHGGGQQIFLSILVREKYTIFWLLEAQKFSRVSKRDKRGITSTLVIIQNWGW